MKSIHCYSMQSNQNTINVALRELATTKTISSALSVCNALLEYMGLETKNVEDIELSKLKLPNAERYDRWFDQHPHFRGDRACFDLTSKNDPLDAKFYALQKRSRLFIAGTVRFTPNFEDHEYTRNDPNMRVGIDFFLTPEKESLIVVLSNKGNLRLVELSGRLTNTQIEILTLWDGVVKIETKNALHATIWESFKLSSLNKKFYEGISNSFIILTQHLYNGGVEEQLANQFANRLHGRILFLWFLRRKKIINESREYFTLGDKNDTEYYSKKLSYLFFDVLNTEISNRDHIQKTKDTLFGVEKENPSLFVVDSVTPYLNGGLFDQKSDGEYWNTHKPTFPIGFFKSLYDHFDSFNFTTDESTPEYEQIAIDPEMLGRIFESFLATLTTETGAQAKKANGAFYTPREIVSYMSRESLRQYLYTALDASLTLRSSIDELLDRSDSEWALAGTNSKRDTVAKEDRGRIINALRAIKVLDPAVGSGAFPMGVLHKILSLFERLDPSFDSYEIKLSILKNNIYGVDIDPTAIEIARLRAWLSIIVDVRDIKKIKPLPNLDFKFVCANSLIGLNSSKQMSIGKYDSDLKSKLIHIRDEYYATSSKTKKEKLQKEYIKLTHPHQNSLLDAEETRQLKSYQPFENGKSASFYDPELMHGVETFNVVIGNPPYIKEYTNKNAFAEIKESPYYQGKMDLWYIFSCKSLDLLKNNGIECFIAQNNWVTSSGASKMRNKIMKDAQIISLVDFGDYKIFETAGIQTMILLIKKVSSQKKYSFELRNIIAKKPIFEDVISILNKIKNKNIQYLEPEINRDALLDKKLVFNKSENENILKKIFTRSNFSLDSKKEVAQGIVYPQDSLNRINKNILNSAFNIGDGIFVLSDKEKISLALTKKELDLIKPLYTTKELHKWFGDPINKEWVIYTDSSFKNNKKINDYPAIKKHLEKFRKIITSDNKPYGLHRARDEFFFKGEKIIVARKCTFPAFSYTDFDAYVSATFYVIKTSRLNQKYLTGILNSVLIAFWLKNKGKMQGSNYQIDKEPILEIPVFVGSIEQQKEIISVVDKIIEIKKMDSRANITNLEKQVDDLAMNLYELTDEEKEIIRSNVN